MEECRKPLVVVLTRNYSTGLSVIRSLGAAGYTVDMVASAFKEGKSAVASCSRYVRNSVEVVSKKVKDGEDTALVSELLKYEGQYDVKPVLFPTDDYTASIMDMNRDKLKEIFIMPEIVGGGQGSMTAHMDKTIQGEIARRVGFPTPKEWNISLREEEVSIPADVVYPCFCKPIESITGYKKEMKRCEEPEELRKHLKRLRRNFADRNVLVQEFLEIDNEIDIGGVCFDQEVIIPAIIRKTNVAQYEKGVTLSGIVVPFEELGELQEKVVAMLKEYHYFGMFDMELNIVGDRIYFNEVNLRSGGPNFSYFRSGVNLPELWVKEATGFTHEKSEECVDAYGKSFIYEKVAWDDHINGFMTKKELNECIAASDITLLGYDEDPAPLAYFTKDIKSLARKRKLKRFKKESLKKAQKFKKSTRRKIKANIHQYPQIKMENQRAQNKGKPRAIVAGRNYCSNLTMARSLGMAGYDVEVLRIFQTRPSRKNPMKRLEPDAFSKYIKAYRVCVARRKSRRIVNALLSLAEPDEKLLLIPADDLVAYIADENYAKLSEFFYIQNVNDTPGEICNLMKKSVQKKLAEDFGLPVVNSCVVRTIGGRYELPEGITYPCFMKPNVSRNSSKGRMRKCYSEEELRGYIEEFSRKKDIEMLIEDFVEIGRECSLLGVSTKDGVVGPGFFFAEEGGQLEHRGVAITGRFVDIDTMQPLVSQLIEFMETLRFNGLYDIDLIETIDGKIYFVEVNMRFGASGYAITESGVNLPGMFADYMTQGKPLDMECRIEPGKTFVSEKVLIEEYVQGRITKEEMKRAMDESDVHFVMNEDDPKAYRHFKKFYPVADVMRKINLARIKAEEKKEENGDD